MSRIVLFGATGFTGRLVATALVRRGASPVLLGRDRERLERLADDLGGGLEVRVSDASSPLGVGATLSPGDVMVTTVGPFLRFGDAAAQAAVDAGAHYLDSTGEPPFVRRVFERYGPAAARRDATMVTAFGYDFVPGNLAGALALSDAGAEAARVDVGYFLAAAGAPGRGPRRGLRSRAGLPSGGTRASLAAVLPEPGFAWRRGRIVSERAARRVRRFDLGGRRGGAVSIGASEHLALPRRFPQLSEVNVYLGWFDPFSRAVWLASAVGAGALRLPGSRRLAARLAARAAGSTGGPSEARRARVRSLVLAEAYDEGGRLLGRAALEGPEPYTFTGELLAWGAMRAADGDLLGTGALGPVDAFGLDALRQGCASAGLVPIAGVHGAAATEAVAA